MSTDSSPLPTFHSVHLPVPNLSLHISNSQVYIPRQRQIHAHSLERNNLLVKIVRDRKGNIKRREIVGIVKKEYKFIALADYQWEQIPLVEQFMQDRREFKLDIAEPDREDAFPAPGQFTASALPLDWGFKPKTIPNNYIAKHSRLVTIGAADAPPDKLQLPLAEATKERIEEIKKLQEFFDAFPLRIRDSLMPVFGDKVINRSVPYVAYFIRGGPFRSIWVRYGVDPRQDSTWRYFQNWFAYKTIPTWTIRLKSVYLKIKPRETYHPLKGWFTEEHIRIMYREYKNGIVPPGETFPGGVEGNWDLLLQSLRDWDGIETQIDPYVKNKKVSEYKTAADEDNERDSAYDAEDPEHPRTEENFEWEAYAQTDGAIDGIPNIEFSDNEIASKHIGKAGYEVNKAIETMFNDQQD